MFAAHPACGCGLPALVSCRADHPPSPSLPLFMFAPGSQGKVLCPGVGSQCCRSPGSVTATALGASPRKCMSAGRGYEDVSLKSVLCQHVLLCVAPDFASNPWEPGRYISTDRDSAIHLQPCRVHFLLVPSSILVPSSKETVLDDSRGCCPACEAVGVFTLGSTLVGEQLRFLYCPLCGRVV